MHVRTSRSFHRMLSGWSQDSDARRATAAREFCTAVTTADQTAEDVFIDWVITAPGDDTLVKSHLQHALKTDSFSGYWYDWETTTDTTELKARFHAEYLQLEDALLEPRCATLCVDATVSPHSTFAVLDVSDVRSSSQNQT